MPPGIHEPPNADNAAPKKRQEGFQVQHTSDLGVSHRSQHHFGGHPQSHNFIDTDMLLSDDIFGGLTNLSCSSTGLDFSGIQASASISAADLEAIDASAASLSHQTGFPQMPNTFGAGGPHVSSSVDPNGFHTTSATSGHMVIPHTAPSAYYHHQHSSFASSAPVDVAMSFSDMHSVSSAGVSKGDADSADGSGGESSGTPATSVISPGSMDNHGSMPKPAHHRRNTSNASAASSRKMDRSVSRSRAKRTSPPAGAGERSDSRDRGGVGKAPTARSRPSRRATVGPAAQAAASAAVNGHLRIDASGAAAAVGPAGAKVRSPRSPTATRSPTFGPPSQGGWASIDGSARIYRPSQQLENLGFGTTFGLTNGSAQLSSSQQQQPQQQQSTWASNQAMLGLPSSPFGAPSMSTAHSTGGAPHHAFISSSMPTQHSFDAHMQHLHLQTPPISHHNNNGSNNNNDMHSNGSQAVNPFLFPPYTQPSTESSAPNLTNGAAHSSHSVNGEFSFEHLLQNEQMLDSEASRNTPSASGDADASGSNGDMSDAKGSTPSEAVPVVPGPTKKKGRSKSDSKSALARSQASRVLENVQEDDADRKASGEESGNKNEDNDEEEGLDDDDATSAVNGSNNKSEAEAKRLAEKRRRRRESHNAVERRRRDNINEKISELATLLPEAMLLDAIATSTQGGNSGSFNPASAAQALESESPPASTSLGGTLSLPGTQGSSPPPSGSAAAYAAALAPVRANSAALAAAQAKPNKGIILRKSVEYIRHLQQFVDMQMSRNSYLENELQRYQDAAMIGCAGAPGTNSLLQPPPGGTSMFGGFSSAANGALPIMEFHADQLMELSAAQSTSGANGNLTAETRILPPPSLADWLGFDQRTGLPRRPSVDHIAEEDEEDLDGQGGVGKESVEERRGRSRKRASLSNGADPGSWPTIRESSAHSRADEGTKPNGLEMHRMHRTEGSEEVTGAVAASNSMEE